MDRDKILLGALAVVAVGVVVWSAMGDTVVPEVQGAVDGVTWMPGYPAGHEHLAHPADIGTVLWGPHPLYCDPHGPGKYRDPMIAQGWSWMSNPPSEATI
jgi:hypothetical protein